MERHPINRALSLLSEKQRIAIEPFFEMARNNRQQLDQLLADRKSGCDEHASEIEARVNRSYSIRAIVERLLVDQLIAAANTSATSLEDIERKSLALDHGDPLILGNFDLSRHFRAAVARDVETLEINDLPESIARHMGRCSCCGR